MEAGGERINSMAFDLSHLCHVLFSVCVFIWSVVWHYPVAIADMRGLISVSCFIPTLVAESLYLPEQDISVHFSVVMLHITDNGTGQTWV